MGRAIDWLLYDPTDVGAWSPAWRRAFLLTLPISGPLYLMACAAYLATLLAGLAAASLACGVGYLWVGKKEWDRMPVDLH